jgi:chorismate lyase/3-hydroxybenzoate synthase
MNALDSSVSPVLFVTFKPLTESNGIASFQEFFRFRFGDCNGQTNSDGIFLARVSPIERDAPDEVWYTNGPVVKGEHGDIRFVKSDHFVALHLETCVDDGASIRELTHQAYSRLIKSALDLGYPHLVRVWNYLPEINRGKDDEECYKQFSVGRANAFTDFDYAKENFPAGTAVGGDAGCPLSITLLTSNESCRTVENPRQNSAYQYPRIYGPQSPSFSRAIIIGDDQNPYLLLSGTASIVGHESRHNDDLQAQVMETVRNIESVVSKGEEMYCAGKFTTPVSHPLFRVYLRRSTDFEPIKRELAAKFGNESQIVFLRGDICRSELELEIEGVIPI